VGTEQLDFAEFYRESKDACLFAVLVSVGDRDVVQAVMKDGGEDLATVWMYLNPDIEDGMTVEGVVRVVTLAASALALGALVATP
jgi:hypothetical protein